MTPHTLLSYALFLLLSAAVVFAAFRLRQRYPLPFLGHFLRFTSLYTAFNFLSTSIRILMPTQAVMKPGPLSLIVAVLLLPLLLTLNAAFLSLAQSLRARPVPRWVRGVFWSLQISAGIMLLTAVFLLSPQAVGSVRSLLIRLFIVGTGLALLIPPGLMICTPVHREAPSRLTLSRTLGVYFLTVFTLSLILIEYLGIPFRWIPDPTSANRILFLFMVSLPLPPMLFLFTHLRRHGTGGGMPAPEGRKNPWGTYALTPREEEIAALVLEGLTNEEIGNRLFISTKTVKNNLTAIFRKMGISNRVQLVALTMGAPVTRQEHQGIEPCRRAVRASRDTTKS